MSRRTTIAGVVLGAVAGLAAGVLTAPKSGKATREDIVDKAKNLKQTAEDTADKVVDDVRQKADDVTQAVRKKF